MSLIWILLDWIPANPLYSQQSARSAISYTPGLAVHLDITPISQACLCPGYILGITTYSLTRDLMWLQRREQIFFLHHVLYMLQVFSQWHRVSFVKGFIEMFKPKVATAALSLAM